MSTAYDPNQELNPNMLVGAICLFVALGFGTVTLIIGMSEAAQNAGAVAASGEGEGEPAEGAAKKPAKKGGDKAKKKPAKAAKKPAEGAHE